MKYTSDNTWNEIMKGPYAAEYIGWMLPPSFCELVPQTMRDLPLKQVEAEFMYR